MSTNVPTEDHRITRARTVLDETTTGHDDYGTAVGQLIELRHVLADVLCFVDETAPGGQLDRVERGVADIAHLLAEIIERAAEVDRP